MVARSLCLQFTGLSTFFRQRGNSQNKFLNLNKIRKISFSNFKFLLFQTTRAQHSQSNGSFENEKKTEKQKFCFYRVLLLVCRRDTHTCAPIVSFHIGEEFCAIIMKKILFFSVATNTNDGTIVYYVLSINYIMCCCALCTASAG